MTAGRGLVHKDSTQCRAWCQEQKRRKEQRRRAAQGDASANEDAEPSVPSVLTQQQAGDASAAAAVDELPDQDTQHQAPEQDEELQQEVFDDVSLASGRHSPDKDKVRAHSHFVTQNAANLQDAPATLLPRNLQPLRCSDFVSPRAVWPCLSASRHKVHMTYKTRGESACRALLFHESFLVPPRHSQGLLLEWL